MLEERAAALELALAKGPTDAERARLKPPLDKLQAQLAAAEMAVERGPVDPEGWPAGFDSGSVLEYLALGHSGVLALQAQKQDFANLFNESALEDSVEWQGGWYLADPAGWIMMRYEDGLDYKAVISDLKFLLKNSGGG